MIQYFFVVFFIVDQIRPIRIKNSSKNIFKENLPVHCVSLICRVVRGMEVVQNIGRNGPVILQICYVKVKQSTCFWSEFSPFTKFPFQIFNVRQSFNCHFVVLLNLSFNITGTGIYIIKNLKSKKTE